MNGSPNPEGPGTEVRHATGLEAEVRFALARRAEHELARRSYSGALVYFAIAVLLAASTPYYRDYPLLLGGIGALMLATGAVRIAAARRIIRSTAPRPRTVLLMRVMVYATVLPWGLFCAITVRLYPQQWTAMFLLLATAALASGATTSLAPDRLMAVRGLLLLVVPTIVAALIEGGGNYLALAAATAMYLAFLITQARQNADAFSKVAEAAELEKRRNSAERQRIEAERAMLAAAIEQAADEILVTDAGGNILYCNPAFERHSGYSRAEVIGQNPRFLNSSRHPESFFREMWEAILAGHVWKGRITNRRKDGSLYEVEGAISPILDGAGRIAGFVSARRDVTDQLRLEAQLQQAQRLESIGRLAGGVAHDFNNLLTVILGYSRVLAEEPGAADSVREYAKEISAAGERAAVLTRRLLSFSRKQILLPRTIELHSVIAELGPMLQRLVGEEVRVEAPLPQRRFFVRADPDQMSQVFMNLAANARDAMPNGGIFTIALAEARSGEVPMDAPERLRCGPSVRLTFSDTGLGMDEETRRHVFEPFFTTKERGRGTGLGLAIVYGIVQQSEGVIDVRSEPGKGADFHIYLPLSPAAEPAAPPEPQAESRGGSETILLAEDQDDLRRLMATVLESRGYRVLEATGGEAALRLARATPHAIHLLLTDVIMPDLNGKQVADELLRSRPDAKVLFVSGYSGDLIARKGVVEGDVAYLAKPFTIEALVAKVREVLDAQVA